MRRKEGYHRTPSQDAWQPTERQHRVLDLLVEGRTNPEIAAALGITVDGAKWHIGELLSLTGLQDRQALARWWAQARTRRQPAFVPLVQLLRRFWPALSLSVFVLAVLIRFSASGNDTGPAVPTAALSDFGGAPEAATPRPALGPPPPCDFPLPADFLSVSGEELIAAGMVRLDDTVDIIESDHCPLRVSNRADRSIAWLPDDGFIANGFTYLGEEWELEVAQLNEAGASGYVARKIGSPVYRFSEDGIFLIVQARNFTTREVRRVAFDSQGRLYLGSTSIPDNTVIEQWTGDALDVSGALRLGRLKPDGRPSGTAYGRGFFLNSCSGDPCGVSYLPGDTQLLVPPLISGTLRCLATGETGSTYEGDIMELDAGNFILRFEELDTDGGKAATRTSAVSCQERTVGPGELIGLHYHYRISATTPDGLPLSLAVSEDSTLYVGEFTNALGCPCSQGQ